MSERFDSAVRLRRLHGMRGYGVYCRIAELTASSPSKKIKYDVDDLAYDMREDVAFIRQIVEEFGLFVIEDGWLEDAFNRSPEAKERQRQEQIKRNRSEGARKAAATRRAKKAQAAPDEPEPEPEEEPAPAPTVETIETADRDSDSARFDRIRDEWNNRFRRESSAIYSDADYCDAFDQALNDQKFSWQFKDALKPSNMQRLLSAFEMEQQKKRKEMQELTPEQQELIEYGNKHGLNWDDFN